ncbi:MAG: hypothetical protein ACHREM_01435 [Polyangiales bacterium]
MSPSHEVVLVEGTFRVVLTPRRRVLAIIDARQTPIGPMHIALDIDRSPFMPSPHDPSFVTAGFFDSIAHAAEGAYHAISSNSDALAHPTLAMLQAATGQGGGLLSLAAQALPEGTRKTIEQASHIVLRAKLGDLDAKQFIRTIGSAAKAGVSSARHIGDALLDATQFVTKVIDVPAIIADKAGVGGIVRSISPIQGFGDMMNALQHGDFQRLKSIAEHQLSNMQGFVSLVPGIGTGISAGLSAGLAVLHGGAGLEIAIRTAYGAIPIPPGIREVTDTVLDAVLGFIRDPHHMTDVAIQVARNRIPAGVARDVFDTLIHIVVQHHPIQKEAGALLDHYVTQYAGSVGGDIGASLAHAGLGAIHLDGGPHEVVAAHAAAPAIVVDAHAVPAPAPARMVQPLIVAAAHV